ncbi:hypothetical protein BLNAU_6847 [Blattamonas nauphoetae]|uniref:Uncharacterized protein n=1 Tax=Blattamonas nauphoetae TaxID=2049346 RepID=A0ABQ9Y327_9EUKA|nr:hypothetical protein BLNAU_6847 [Blattamonas nauphoetae]
MDCSPFLNWDEEKLESESENAVVFQSLVATMKLQPALDDSLEAKTVKFLKYVDPQDSESANTLLNSFGQTSAESLTNFIQSIGVLISSPNQIITSAAMEMLNSLIWLCSPKFRLALIKADLIPQLITTLNPRSISFDERVDIHTNFMNILTNTLWPTTPYGLSELRIKDRNERQAVHETVLTHVLIPSEKYICHLCVNRYSLIDGEQSSGFMTLLARLLRMCPYYQPTMDSVLNMPVILSIPSSLADFANDSLIWSFMDGMVDIQQDWNDEGGEVREMGKILHRMLRMEGIEDVIEEKLRNDRNQTHGRDIVFRSIIWSNEEGMNIQERW